MSEEVDKRCDTCAFREGCVTYEEEPHNKLRAEICVTAPLPFHCHYSKAGDWSTLSLANLNATEAMTLRRELKICEGWRAEVKRRAARGEYADRETRKILHWAGIHALQLINKFIAASGTAAQKAIGDDLMSTLKLLKRRRGRA